jgi:hypothetical protein
MLVRSRGLTPVATVSTFGISSSFLLQVEIKLRSDLKGVQALRIFVIQDPIPAR